MNRKIMFLRIVLSLLFCMGASLSYAQVTTQGFLNLARPEVPGTLLSHPVANGAPELHRPQAELHHVKEK